MNAARDINGPWMRPDILNRTPLLRREFDLNRDAYIRRQILDQERSEKQRRDESASRGHVISRKKQDRPAPILKPKQAVAKPAGRDPAQGFLTAQRDAVMAHARVQEPYRSPQHEQSKDLPLPSL